MRTPVLPLLDGELAACCSPLTGGALDEEAAERIARVSGRSATGTGSGCYR